MQQNPRAAWRVACGLTLACLFPSSAVAQSAPAQIVLPTVTVVAQKEPANPQDLPVSVTVVPATWIDLSRLTSVSDSVLFSPNTVVTEFTARKLSNPRVRGVGSSPSNPAITTYLDGVPILNANASSLEFTGVSQVEFVRGPQSALFGRNTLGGVINIGSTRPSLSGWHGEAVAPFGEFGSREIRAAASGPVNERIALGFSGGYAERDGFTVNAVTGNDLDSRSANFGKAQVLFSPSSRWETRVLLSGESAEDGDYALGDLGAVRSNPFVVARDFEGYTHRDVFNTTVINRYEGARIAVTATTGYVRWDTDDQTDLDYTPLPIARRSNLEEATQLTQEVRVGSSPRAAVDFGAATLRWQAGALFFTQDYAQEAVNTLAPFTLSPQISFAVSQTSPRAALDDRGIGIYGQGTLTLGERLDLVVGARVDHERKQAVLETFFTPLLGPPTLLDAEESFINISPQLAVAYRLQPNRLLYATVSRGFKAGGFNPASPLGSEAFDEEHSWNAEGGVKTSFAGGRLAANAAVFFISWEELQLNLPNPQVPAQFFIANVGSASSRGVELELTGRPLTGLDVFGTFGYTRARFGDNTASTGLDVSGNRLPFTPQYTLSGGAQYSRPVTTAVSLYGRGELVSYGEFDYDETNTAAQEAYALVHLRAGARARFVYGEVWLRNAFDTRYVPLAFAFPGLAPSGYLGEAGRPRTLGVSVGVTF